MNTTIARIREGTIARVIRAAEVSPITRWTNPLTAPASATQTTRISTAAITFGR